MIGGPEVSRGGCIAVEGDVSLTIRDSSLRECFGGLGGAVSVTFAGASAAVYNSGISDCSGSNGGAVYVGGVSAELYMSNCVISGNVASAGGGMYLAESTLTTLSNTGNSLGGGLFTVSTDVVTVNGTSFVGNTATSGGAVGANPDIYIVLRGAIFEVRLYTAAHGTRSSVPT